MALNPPSTPRVAISGLKRLTPRALKEGSIKYLCLACALISICTTIGIVYTLIVDAMEFFRRVPFIEYISGTTWSPTIKPESFGVLPLIAGTMQIAIGAGLIAVPLGLLAAIYLSEYAKPGVRNVLKPLLEILAGIPTVVYGYFAVFFVTPILRQLFGEGNVEIYNAASAFIVVGIMILPLVTSLCEDAIQAVPKALREGAYGLGSTKLEVTAKIVVPAALSGIMAAFILALSRAVGETMAVTLAAGSRPQLTWNPLESVQTMTAFIVQISKGDTPHGTTSYYTLFAVGLTLFVITLAMNLLAARLVKRFRQVYV